MKKGIEEILEKIKDLGWSVYTDSENSVTLGKYSPAGQDFSITVNTEDDKDLFIENIYEIYNDFDVSYETYQWLDNEGHGTDGAPYDMKDLYEDMETCVENVRKLYEKLIPFKINHIE